MRRLFYIIFAIVLLVVIAVLVWIFFFSGQNKGGIVSSPTNPFPESPGVGSIFRLPVIFDDNKKDDGSEFEVTTAEEQVLTKLWDKPVAGYIFTERQIIEQVASTTVSGSTTLPSVEQRRATSSLVLFVDRTTGYIHQYDPKTGNLSQVSNTLVPGVYDALFISSGSFVVFRSFDEASNSIISTLYRVPTTSLLSDAVPLEKMSDLPRNIVSLAVNEKGNQFSFIEKTKTGGALHVYTKDQGSGENPFPPSGATVTQLPLYEWDLVYGGSVLYMTPKASAYIPGYTVEAFSGRRVVSNKTGLVSIASNDELFVFSTMLSQAGLVSFLTNRTTGENLSFPIKTIASKCSFEGSFSSVVCGVPAVIPLKKQGYPDDWYQGVAQFQDDLYRITKEGKTSLLIKPKDFVGEDFDIWKPSFNKTADFLLFTNKKDGALWLANFALINY